MGRSSGNSWLSGRLQVILGKHSYFEGGGWVLEARGVLALAAGGSVEEVPVFEAFECYLKVDSFLSCTVSRLIVSGLSSPPFLEVPKLPSKTPGHKLCLQTGSVLNTWTTSRFPNTWVSSQMAKILSIFK